MMRELILGFDSKIYNLNMLVLPGGGIKGYMPALTMQSICKEFNIKENLFIDDYQAIGGTSIGGILAIALVCGVTPTDLVKLFEEEGKKIFKGSWMPEWLSFLRFAYSGNALYDRNGLINAISKVIPHAETTKIKDLPKRVLLTTMKTEEIDGKNVSTPLYITNINSIEDNDITREFTLMEACLMTSAAPVYFEPYKKDNISYIDGAVWRNNPVTAIINAMRSEFIYSRRQCVLTIGCGSDDFTMVKNKKLLQAQFKQFAEKDEVLKDIQDIFSLDGLPIIMHVLKSAMGGPEEASHHDSLLFEDYNCLDTKAYYYRFQPSLIDAKDTSIDNITDEFFQYMKNKVATTFKDERKNIKNFYERVGLDC